MGKTEKLFKYSQWNSSVWRIAVLFPLKDRDLRPYGESGWLGVRGALVKNADKIPISVKFIDSSNPKQLMRQLEKLDPCPHVCLGIIRSNVAREVEEFCRIYECLFIGTDNAATRFMRDSESITWPHFRVTKLTDQMVRVSLQALSFICPEARRVMLVVSAYEYGRSIQEECLRLALQHPSWLKCGFTDVFEYPIKPPKNEYIEYFLELLSQSRPDAILLGMWGPSLKEFLNRVMIRFLSSYSTVIIIPDSGWDDAATGIGFPKKSIVGSRYYINIETGKELRGRQLIQELKKCIKSENAFDFSVRYQIAASYSGTAAVISAIKELQESQKNSMSLAHSAGSLSKKLKSTKVTIYSGIGKPEICHFAAKDAEKTRYYLPQSHRIAIAKFDKCDVKKPKNWNFYSEDELCKQLNIEKKI